MSESFNQANKTIHPVETQWHYPILTKYGFEPIAKEGIGFVRSYTYIHPATQCEIIVTTGASADYWKDTTNKEFGYWKALEPHLKQLNQ